MIRKTIYFTFLFWLAWNLMPTLNGMVSFIPLEKVAEWLTDQFIEIFTVPGAGGREAKPFSFYVKVLLWVFIFWLFHQIVIKPLQGLFGLTVGFAERKIYRRTQFFLLEIMLFLFPTILVFVLAQIWRDFYIFIYFEGGLPLPGDIKDLPSLIEFVDKNSEIVKVYFEPNVRISFTIWILKENLGLLLIVSLGWFIFSNYFIFSSFAPFYERIIRFLESGLFGRGGSGRFAGFLEECNENHDKYYYSLFYGKSLYTPFLNLGSQDDRHMLTFAGSRSGKGTSCIIPNLLMWGGSAFVIDPKGTAAQITAKYREKEGQGIHYVDPFAVASETSACFNPLEHLDPHALTIVEEIGQIAEALIIPEQDERNKHFSDGAKSLLSGYIAQAISDPEIKNPSLVTVYQMLSYTPEERERLHAKMKMNEGVGGIAKRAAMRVLQGKDKGEFQSVQATALEQTYWLSSLAMQRVLASSSFRFEEMKERPTTIYLIVPPQFLDFHKRFLRLFINMGLTRFPMGGRARIPTLFILDEAHTLGRMEEIARAYGLLAGYNMIVWAFFQDKGQLDRLYSAESASFVSSSRAVQVFAVTDANTVGFVNEMIGERPLVKSLVRATEAIDLRSPGDIRKDIAKDTMRQYVLRSGRAPLILERQEYWKSLVLADRAAPDPDYGIGNEWVSRYRALKEAIKETLIGLDRTFENSKFYPLVMRLRESMIARIAVGLVFLMVILWIWGHVSILFFNFLFSWFLLAIWVWVFFGEDREAREYYERYEAAQQQYEQRMRERMRQAEEARTEEPEQEPEPEAEPEKAGADAESQDDVLDKLKAQVDEAFEQGAQEDRGNIPEQERQENLRAEEQYTPEQDAARERFGLPVGFTREQLKARYMEKIKARYVKELDKGEVDDIEQIDKDYKTLSPVAKDDDEDSD